MSKMELIFLVSFLGVVAVWVIIAIVVNAFLVHKYREPSDEAGLTAGLWPLMIVIMPVAWCFKRFNIWVNRKVSEPKLPRAIVRDK